MLPKLLAVLSHKEIKIAIYFGKTNCFLAGGVDYFTDKGSAFGNRL